MDKLQHKLKTNISPFVDVFKQIGFPKAAMIMNIVAISAALPVPQNAILTTTAAIAITVIIINSIIKIMNYHTKQANNSIQESIEKCHTYINGEDEDDIDL